MNTKNMLPTKIPLELEKRYIPSEVAYECSISRKVSMEGEWKEEESIEVTKYYLDTNNHVNNTFYVLWAESLLSSEEEIGRIRIDYRKAARYKDRLRVFRCEEEDRIGVRFLNQEEELLCIVAFYRR